MKLLKQVNARVSVWYNPESRGIRQNMNFEVHIDSVSDGDHVYAYDTERGAKIAAARFAKIYNK